MISDKKVEKYYEKVSNKIKEIKEENAGWVMTEWSHGNVKGQQEGLKMALDILNEVINTESEDK